MGYIALALSSGVFLGIWKFGLSFYRGRISSYAVVLFSAAGEDLGVFLRQAARVGLARGVLRLGAPIPPRHLRAASPGQLAIRLW